jgi:hypothetical protein
MAPSLGKLARGVGLGLLGFGLPALLADRALGWLGTDWGAVAPTLYYNGVDLPLYQPSDDPFLIYEMAPGASYEHPMRGYSAHINSAGARGEEHPWERAEGVYRVLFFGTSSIFGAAVDDHESTPARLETLLEEASGRAVEVWNFGTSGYSTSQVARKARRELARVPSPDLVLVSYLGCTRRPLLPEGPMRPGDPAGQPRGPVDNVALFALEPSLWLENFPDSALSSVLGFGLHQRLLQLSPSYRYLAAVTVSWEREEAVSGPREATCAAEQLALEREATQLGLPLVYVNHPQHHGQRVEGSRLPVIELERPGRPPAYREIHPPAEQLEAWAVVVAEGLPPLGLGPTADQNE